MMIRISIQKDPIQFNAETNFDKETGAELIFFGHVRDMENGESIIGLVYEHYEEMALRVLNKIAEKAVKKFRLKNLFCIHRVGFIPIGESSLFVQVWSKHRKSGLEAMEWFIDELKKDVPIWKWAVRSDGSKIPSY